MQDDEVLLRRAAHRLDGNAAVKRHQAPGVGRCEREQVGVGDLSRTEHAIPDDAIGLEQAEGIGPEGVCGVFERLRQPLGDDRRRLRVGIGRQRQDALARRELAALNAKRYVDLGEKNFISSGVVEGKLQEQTSADAAVNGADANLNAARQDLKRLAAERAGLLQQRYNVRLLAPSDGVVVSRDAEVGSTVVAGQPVLKLIEPSSLWVTVRFDQGRSAGLAPGLRAQIVLRSTPDKPIAGEVSRVEAISDSVTEERVAQVAFDSLPAGVSVGELAEVTLSLPAPPPALLVPNASIKRRAEASVDMAGEPLGVWLAEGNSLRFAPVRLGQSGLDGRVQVLDGLKAGDRVVVYSEKELSSGSRVKVVDNLTPRVP